MPSWHPCKLTRLLHVHLMTIIMWTQLFFLCLSLSYMYSNEKLKPFIEVYYLALFFRCLDYKLVLFL